MQRQKGNGVFAAEAPEVDPRSPYFAHLRLEEDGEQRDLCLGRATRIESGVRIVDWRHAPISRLFYRYQQGDDYEEQFGGKTRSGVVRARRLGKTCERRVDLAGGEATVELVIE